MKAKVLVVEDSKPQREHLVGLLNDNGYDVRSANGGIEALGLIKADPPDIVLLDVVLDGMDGYSVCRWLRLGESTRDIVVIMLTSKVEAQERAEGLHVGADDYVPKPFDIKELDARIFAALRSRAARLELRNRNQELEGMLTRTERLAMTDALTGVFNRRRFADVLKREFATSRRYKVPLSLVLIDLDKLILVNDVDGIIAGDETLKRVAEILATSIREVDVCARYGGDEFALLLPHTDAEPARVVAQRVQEKLEHAKTTFSGAARQLTLSFGIASTSDGALKSPDELIESADRALFDAKRSGRNCVALAVPGTLSA